MEQYQFSFPRVQSQMLHSDIEDMCLRVSQNYYGKILPICKQFNMKLLTDEAVMRYISAPTLEPLYRDIKQTLNEDKIFFLEGLYESMKKDLWGLFRAQGCDAKNPEDDDFDFEQTGMGYAPAWLAEKVLKCISVKDGTIKIDSSGVYEESIMVPTDRHRRLFDLLTEFCNDFNRDFGDYARGFRRLVFIDHDGRLTVNAKQIMEGASPLHRG